MIEICLDSAASVVCSSQHGKCTFSLLCPWGLYLSSVLCLEPSSTFFFHMNLFSLGELSLTFSGSTNLFLHCVAYDDSLRFPRLHLLLERLPCKKTVIPCSASIPLLSSYLLTSCHLPCAMFGARNRQKGENGFWAKRKDRAEVRSESVFSFPALLNAVIFLPLFPA